jgi:hypothetical protein
MSKTAPRPTFPRALLLALGWSWAWAAWSAPVAEADWDRALPSLELRGVTIAADSLEAAWKQLSTRHLARSILYVADAQATSGRFDFHADRCQVRDVLGALTKTYPGFIWEADPVTGVLWIHPKELAWDALLPKVLRLPRSYCAVPLQTGVLAPLGSIPGAHLAPVSWGTAFTNTFDVAVDLAKGDYPLRELLGHACKAHPTKTFLVRARGQQSEILAVNLASDELTAPPEGAVGWWGSHFGAPAGGAPTAAELLEKLAAPSEAQRQAARAYLEAIVWQVDLDALVARLPSSPLQSTWAAIGVASVIARHPEATHRASIGVLESASGRLSSQPGGAPAALLASLELARLTGDQRPLTGLPSSFLTREELASVIGDVMRIAHASPAVRTALLE